MTRKAVGRQSQTRARDALIAARALLEEWLETEIVSYASPETASRPGSVTSSVVGYFYNTDTINEVDALRSVRRHRRIIKQIDAALNDL